MSGYALPSIYRPTARDVERIGRAGRGEWKEWLRRQSPERVRRWLDADSKAEVLEASFVAERAKSSSSASTSTISSGSYSGVTVGNLLVFIVGYGVDTFNVSRDYSSVSDTGSNIWTLATHAATGNQATGVGIAVVFSVAASATGNVTVTLNGATPISALKLEEFSGTAASSVHDASNSNGGNASASSGTTPSVTAAKAGELAVSGWVMGAAESSFTVGGSYTQAGTTVNGAPAIDIACEYLLSASAGAQTASGSWATAAGWASSLSFFNVTAAAAAATGCFQ